MANKNIEQQGRQFDVYVQQLSDKLKQGTRLYSNGQSLVVQGLLLVYFNILSSAFKYLSDLKQNKEFTFVQNYAFNILQEDVREYQNVLGPALKNLNTIPPFLKNEGNFHVYTINTAYAPLVKLSRTYLPSGPGSDFYVGYEKNIYVYYEKFLARGADNIDIKLLTRYCEHSDQYKTQIAENKQAIMQELGKELQDFFVVSNLCGNWHSDDFFYWFGHVINSIWQGPEPLITIPWDDSSQQVIELLTATRNMGDKYFDSLSAKLYLDMLRGAVIVPGCGTRIYSKSKLLEFRQRLFKNPNTHPK